MRRKCSTKGWCGIVFAVSLLLSCFCPPRFLIAVLALWVIVLGFSTR